MATAYYEDMKYASMTNNHNGDASAYGFCCVVSAFR